MEGTLKTNKACEHPKHEQDGASRTGYCANLSSGMATSAHPPLKAASIFDTLNEINSTESCELQLSLLIYFNP